ncbi:hypothetical protein QR680_008000 [Steinernema hermaphroditum]|uniref:Uncharacterized protein n=1 Tax=Steinernema hermaphroditum TaxID=289476 RepID=A0AA39M684_9BILA|nr:hypothetical protein QR680_008000 [Steinernema hermaphroditum]
MCLDKQIFDGYTEFHKPPLVRLYALLSHLYGQYLLALESNIIFDICKNTNYSKKHENDDDKGDVYSKVQRQQWTTNYSIRPDNSSQ